MRRYITAFLLFAALGFSIYSNTFRVPFHFDDYEPIVENSGIHLKDLSPGSFMRVLSDDRPVAVASFALNYYFGGLDVSGFHLVNTVTHILTAFGLFLFLHTTLSILYSWPKGRIFFLSLFASLLWLINPIQAETVIYISQRATILAAMFYVYSIFFYAKGRLSHGWKRVALFFLCAASAFLSIESKESGFMLPIFLFLYELCVFRRGRLGSVKERSFYVPALVVAMFFLLFVAAFHPKSFESIASPYTGMGSVIRERLFTQSRVFFLYASIFLLPLPSRLSIEHDPALSRALLDPPSTLFAVAALSLIAIYSFFSVKRSPLYAFFSLWFLGNLLIESMNINLPVMQGQRVYLAGMGAAVIVGKVTTEALYDRKWLRHLIPVLVIALFSVNTHIWNRIWKDPVSLWSDAVRKSPYSVNAHVGLGLSLMNIGQMEEAIAELKRAKAISPRDPSVRYYLGVAYYEWKVYDMALNEFRAVWTTGFDSPEGRPTIDDYYFKMARSILAHGNIERGRELLREARRFHPENLKVKELLEKVEEGKLTAEDLRPEG